MRKTREVRVGKVGIGGDNPVRIQSMTTSDTRDSDATVEQIVRLEQAGCEIVRVTVQGMKEAESCRTVQSALAALGCGIPLVADIHFYPPAAMKVVEFVDKVRINPGNFLDKRAMFIQKEYDDASYAAEIEKIREGFAPLVHKCKALGKPIRIGTNHGSLSDRIMNRYGDTPKGMVESALEFARIARECDFHDIIFSMKASNPMIMIEAYRMLAEEMDRLGWDYPLHLGVTEAGEGEDGRVKSAVGIGALLVDGLGDTIRVSLTEDPWEEIEPCKVLVSLADRYKKRGGKSLPLRGNSKKGMVLLSLSAEEIASPDLFRILDITGGKRGLFTPDFLRIEEPEPEEGIYQKLFEAGITLLSEKITGPFFTKIRRWETIADGEEITGDAVLLRTDLSWDTEALVRLRPRLVILYSEGFLVPEARDFFRSGEVPDCPVLIGFEGRDDFARDTIVFSAEVGSLLVDGLSDGVAYFGKVSLEKRISLVFSLLQATRRKTVKTEFISCPGCGRTLFDLQTVSRRIREKTAHLPGVRIAIMGCIVNGPGEMADADFGYVGSLPGKVDLYIGKTRVEKHIDFAEADDRLIALIKREGKWVDPVLR